MTTYNFINAGAWRVGVVSKAFIAPFKPPYGFKCPFGKCFARLTDGLHREVPQKITDSAFRMHTEGIIDYVPGTIPVLKVVQEGGFELWKLRGHVGAFGAGLLKKNADKPKQQFDIWPIVIPYKINRTSGRIFVWSFTVYGRPHPMIEASFWMGGIRKCRYIWHELDLVLDVPNIGNVSFSLDIPQCSAFPSHSLWVITPIYPLGKQVLTKPQGLLSNLWHSAPPPPTLDSSFVRL